MENKGNITQLVHSMGLNIRIKKNDVIIASLRKKIGTYERIESNYHRQFELEKKKNGQTTTSKNSIPHRPTSKTEDDKKR
jgi:hypothetical protein